MSQRENKMSAVTETWKQKSYCEVLFVILKWVRKNWLGQILKKNFLTNAQNSPESWCVILGLLRVSATISSGHRTVCSGGGVVLQG